MRRSLLALLLVIACGAACKESGSVQVSSITFSGNKAVDNASLKAVIATRENGFILFGRKAYFDRTEFDRDVKRIEAYYADHGYPDAKVTGVDVELNDAKDKVDIKVDISEGSPIIVESVQFEGLQVIPENHLDRLKARAPLVAGVPRNQTLIVATHDLIVSELRDHGFPYGTVKMAERPGSSSNRVQIVAETEPGPSAVFGEITIQGNRSVGEEVIRRELSVRQGQQYRLSEITESQRRLYALELFQFTNITPRLPENRAPEVPLMVTVAEGKLRRLELGAGYGSEEKARAHATWRNVNFTGGARVLETEARYSSLEQGFRGSLTEPHLMRQGLSLRMSGSSWWASEPSYTYSSSGGRVTLMKRLGRATVGLDRGSRNELSVTLINEYERYTIAPEALADPNFRDDLIALGLDPVTGSGRGRLAALDFDVNRDTSGNPLDPRRGYLASIHMETADNWLGGSFRYQELVLEGRKYFQLRPRLVWATRAKVGTLAGSNSSLIPFFKRYFVGGSSSVRGWGRYQVSPLTEDGLPVGGRSMVDASTEVRFGVRGRLSAVLFVDGGNVWEDAFQYGKLRWAVGPGVRYNTPIGPIRFDIGKQLNPIPGLVINGNPEKRTWRVHFSIGQAF